MSDLPRYSSYASVPAESAEPGWDETHDPALSEDLISLDTDTIFAEAQMTDLRLRMALHQARMGLANATLIAACCMALAMLLAVLLFRLGGFLDTWIQLLPAMLLLCLFGAFAAVVQMRAFRAALHELGDTEEYLQALLHRALLSLQASRGA